MQKQPPELSVVTTLYQSAPYLREFYQRTLSEIKKIGFTYEFVLVNDGSPDDSLEVALDLQRQDSHIVVVDLSRNFGHHEAIFQGLTLARGLRIFLIDSDLEESPELLSKFMEKFSETSCDVAYGVQVKRKGGIVERLSGGIFYKLFNYLADIDVPENCMIARLMSRRYVDALLSFQEHSLFLGGLMSATGFLQVPVYTQKLHKGSTTYTLRRKIEVFITAVTSFSAKPLQLIFYSGFCISAVSVIYIAWLTALRLFFDTHIDGFTTLAVSIWLLGGLIILFLGIIGIYVAKIFVQTKNRPLSIVRQVYAVDDHLDRTEASSDHHESNGGLSGGFNAAPVARDPGI
jgi:putative glycosyltransferase